jgi:hypothetical protein
MYRFNFIEMGYNQKLGVRLERVLLPLYMPPSLPPRGPGGWGLLAFGAFFASVVAEKGMKRLFK